MWNSRAASSPMVWTGRRRLYPGVDGLPHPQIAEHALYVVARALRLRSK